MRTGWDIIEFRIIRKNGRKHSCKEKPLIDSGETDDDFSYSIQKLL
jgi:hypothetical protein